MEKERLDKAQAAKRQAESVQKADAWRKKDLPRPRQLNAKLNQCRKQTHGEREKPRLKLLSTNQKHLNMWRRGESKTLRPRKGT